MSNKDILNDLVSVHLGKAGDGSVVKPYVTPDEIDASLLVPVPRNLNREQYDINEDDLPFEGFDTWNCYEVSALLENGYPVSGVVKLTYPASSKFIVESKSLKLYLNSFNMARVAKTLTDAIGNIEKQIYEDLTKALEVEEFDVDVAFYDYKTQEDFNRAPDAVKNVFTPLEDLVDIEDMEFKEYNEDPDILEVVDNNSMFSYRVTSNALRSNCRVTNQPDWGDVYIAIDGPQVVTPESLLRYIVSMRRENHFHEEICECIYKRLYDILPRESNIAVICLYTRRGGIDINPARGTDEYYLDSFARALSDPYDAHKKTARQ